MALGARRYWAVWVVVVPLVLWVLVRVLGLDGGTAIAFLLAFTPQVAVAALFVTGIAVVLRNWAAAAVAALAAIVLAAEVLPRALGNPEDPPPGSELVDVMSSNVHFGTADATALAALVRDEHPDLLAVQELTPRFDRRLRAAGIERLLPFRSATTEPPALGGGRGLYSRFPLRRLAGRTTSSVLMTLPGGRALRVFNVHPRTPRPGGSGIWASSLGRLPSAGEGLPWILIGDFNATLDTRRCATSSYAAIATRGR